MDKNKIINIYTIVITIIAVIAIVIGVSRFAGGFSIFGNKISGGKPADSDATIACDKFTEIDVDVEVSTVTITTGDKYQVSYSCSSSSGRTVEPAVKVDGNKLKVSQSIRPNITFGINNESCDIKITVPADATISDIQVKSDVGEINFDKISFDTATIKTDVGDTILDEVTAKKVTLKSDVGDIKVKNSTIDFIDADGDIGDIKVEDTISSEVVAENSVGDITLDNVYDANGNEPRTDLDCSVGDEKVNK